MKVAYFPSFFVGVNHGGKKRTHQIYSELVNAYGNSSIDVFDIEHYFKEHKYSVFIMLKVTIILLCNFSFYLSFKTQFKRSFTKFFVKKSISKDVYSKIAIEQAPGFSLFFCDYFIDNNLDYDLYLHNIEFCVNGQSFTDDGYIYETVKASYINAKKIVTISKLDNDISKIFNLNSVILPYKFEIVDQNQKLNIGRHETGQGKVGLILGSVKNPPTKAGITKLVERINSDRSFFTDFTFILVGFSTDTLRYLASDRVDVRGEVTDTELQSLVGEVDAFFVYQPPTSGWLTRITEMETKQLPIYINEDYSQATYHCKRATFYSL